MDKLVEYLGQILIVVAFIVAGLFITMMILVLKNHTVLQRTCRQMIWSPDWHNHRCCAPRFTEHHAHRCRCGFLWEVV